jgi:hypothetical protein
MRNFLAVLVAVAGAIAVVSLAPGPFVGQAPTAVTKAAATWKPSSRTPDGQPDLQGVWVFGNSPTPLERPSALAGKEFYTDEEVAALEKKAAENRFADTDPKPGDPGTYNQFWFGNLGKAAMKRTSLIVDPPDGKLPSLTPAAQKKKAEWEAYSLAHPADSWLDRSAYERCIARQIPRTGGAMANPGARILQTPGFVMIFYENVHDTRVIPLDGRPHIGPNIRQWNGDSRGRWEGNTLIVDTTNFTEKMTYHLLPGLGGLSQESLHLVERFTRLDADTIKYEATVDDPGTWTRPWTFVLAWWKDPEYQELFEYACHEGNYGMSGILGGARADEKAAAAKK